MHASAAGDDAAAAAPPTSGSREEIFDAAARILSRRGYEATTTRAIAQAAGIKAGTIYHYFGSKDDIVQVVIDRGVDIVREAVVEALANAPKDDPRRRLAAAIAAHLRSSLEYSDYTSACIRSFSFVPEKIRQKNSERRRRYEDVWRELVAELRAAGALRDDVSADSVRLLLLGAMNWAGEWYRPDRLTIEQIADDFALTVLK